jgi:hypothetical protein
VKFTLLYLKQIILRVIFNSFITRGPHLSYIFEPHPPSRSNRPSPVYLDPLSLSRSLPLARSSSSRTTRSPAPPRVRPLGGTTLRRAGRADLRHACGSSTRGGTTALRRGAVPMAVAAQDGSPRRPRDALPPLEISTDARELWRLACRVDEGSRREPLHVRIEGRKIRAPHHSGVI